MQDQIINNSVRFDTQTGRRLNAGEVSSPTGASFDVNTGQKINTLTSDSLNRANTRVTTPTVTPQDFQTPLEVGVNSTVSTLKNQLAQDQAQVNTGRTNISSLYSKLGLEEEMKQKAYEDTGANEARKNYEGYVSQIEEEQRALDKKIRTIEQNREGIYGGGITSVVERQKSKDIEQVRSQSLERQADLAILANSAGRNYDRLTELSDAKVNAKIAPIKLELEKEKLFYSENRDMMTKKEQRAYEAMITEDERKYNETKLQEQNLQKIKTEMLISANEQGAPEAVKRAIQSALTIEDAINSAGVYGGDMLDRQIKQAQLEKTKAEQNITSLPPAIQTRVQTIANQFDNEQAVKSYQISAEAIDALNTAGTSPTDDQSRIYAFAKVMDPNSVVRESEYKTVQDYSMALFQKAGFKAKRVFANTGFLTDEARRFMKQTLENRLASSKKAYDNIYSEYGRRINKITGQTDGTDYVTDYSRAFTTPQTSGNIITAPDGTQIEIID